MPERDKEDSQNEEEGCGGEDRHDDEGCSTTSGQTLLMI